jgi:CubicO group peptidase (beta-lactamase class C family)
LRRKVIYDALNFGKPWKGKSCQPKRDMTMKRALMVMLLGVVMPISPLAQEPRRNPRVNMLGAIAAGPTDPKEFEAWMDRFLADYLKRSSASLGFVLVTDGKIFFQKGYGYADAEKKTPVVPDQTLFYAASVSKLVTATAVMQLIEQGKLRADADVNTYLTRFQLENNYPAPVTVANLLTHTSGLDDSFIVGSVDRPSDLVSLGDFFTKNPPRRGRLPGEQIVYSNMGMAFAGYLVEAVAGVSFYDYAEQNVFRPLGMEHSSFRRPFPSNLAPSVATAGVAGQPPDKTAIQPYPAESLVSTVTDMGHFIVAHLNDGRFYHDQILSEASAREMHRQHFTQHPHMPGVAYGFFESYMNGRRALFHTGGGRHESLLYLLPDEHVGFYLVYSGELERNFAQAFLDHYYPAAGPFNLPNPPLDFAQRAKRFTGLYRPNFIAMTSIEKLVGLVADTHVVSNDDGTLTLRLPPLGSKSLRMVEVEPLLFRAEEGFYVTFSEDGKGNITRMFTSGSIKDPTAYDRLRWYERGLLHAGLGAAGFLIFLSFPVISMIGFIRRRWRKARSERQSATGEPRLAWRMATLVSLLVVITPLPVLTWMLFGDHSRPSQFRAAFHISSGALLLAALLGLTLSIFASIAWKHGDWTTLRRVYYSVVALSALLMVPFLYHWNLLRF